MAYSHLPQLLTRGQIATEIIGISADHFTRIRPDLEAMGFPKPLDIPGRRGGSVTPRWSRTAIESWIINTSPQNLRELMTRLMAGGSAAEAAADPANSGRASLEARL